MPIFTRSHFTFYTRPKLFGVPSFLQGLVRKHRVKWCCIISSKNLSL